MVGPASPFRGAAAVLWILNFLCGLCCMPLRCILVNVQLYIHFWVVQLFGTEFASTAAAVAASGGLARFLRPIHRCANRAKHAQFLAPLPGF